MSVADFRAGAGAYGLLTSLMAAGAVLGALMTAARAKPGIPVLLGGVLIFGLVAFIYLSVRNYATETRDDVTSFRIRPARSQYPK